MIALALLCVVLAASTADGGAPCDCSKVNCKNYKFEIVPWPYAYGECRFVMRDDSTDLKKTYRSGLQIWRYQDKPVHLGGVDRKTRDCPVKKAKGITKLLLTSSPRFVDDLSSMIGPKVFQECCIRPILRQCHYHVKIYMNCHKNAPMPTDPKNNDRRDDELLRMVVVYRIVVNKKPNGKKGHFEKLVWVTFDAKKKTVSCKNNFNKLSASLGKGDGSKVVKYCGDSEINVTLMRYRAQYPDGYKYTMLKAQRYQCNSQYAAMFTDPHGWEKFTMRTQLTGRDPTMSAVLAQTKKHACGPIVKSIKYIPPVLGP